MTERQYVVERIKEMVRRNVLGFNETLEDYLLSTIPFEVLEKTMKDLESRFIKDLLNDSDVNITDVQYYRENQYKILYEDNTEKLVTVKPRKQILEEEGWKELEGCYYIKEI